MVARKDLRNDIIEERQYRRYIGQDLRGVLVMLGSVDALDSQEPHIRGKDDRSL